MASSTWYGCAKPYRPFRTGAALPRISAGSTEFAVALAQDRCKKAGCMTVFVDAAINPPKMTQARLIALLTFLVLTLATLIALGTWQLQRRAWKADLIQKFEQNLDGLPVPYQGPASEIGPSAREFRKVAVRGRFLEKSDILVFAPTPSQFQGLTTEGYGYFVFTPFVAALEQRSTIMFINRGFAPASFALSSGSLPPVGDVTVEGMIRLPEEPTFATPEPGITKRIFYTAQIDAMSKTLALSADAIVAEYVEDLTPAVPKMWPRPRNPKLLLETIPNSHLQYALTWFSLAGTLVGVFAVFGLQRMRHRSSPG